MSQPRYDEERETRSELADAITQRNLLEWLAADLSENGSTRDYEQTEHELAVVEEEIAALEHRLTKVSS
jgi:flagellar motility protein MotE (MotC chaperone)